MPLRPIDYLHDPRLDNGTARVLTQPEQVARILESFRQETSAIEPCIYLASLQDRNEHLIYRVVTDHIEEMMPIIYPRPSARPASGSRISSGARAACT